MNDNSQSSATRQTASIRIEKMVYGGEGLARTPEGVVLVPLVLPGETVGIELDERHKGVRRGRLLQVMEPVPGRVPPGCSYFGRCGGCQYQHIGYEQQLEFKRQILSESFERIGKLRLGVPIHVISGEPWEYRNRTRLQVENEAGEFEIGYFELLSHRLCSIDHCPVSAPAISRAVSVLAHGIGEQLFPHGKAEIELFTNDSGQMLATVYSDNPAPPDFGEKLRAAVEGLESVCWNQRSSRKAVIKIWGGGAIVYHIGEFHYRVAHESFFQVNRFLFDRFIEAVAGDLKGKNALELYAGVGLFTLPLTRRFEKIAAVEACVSSAADLASNLGVAGTRARSYQLTAEKFLATAAPVWDAIIADPPRGGLSKTAREHIARLRPQRFVYISCDPTTLVRDVAGMLQSGYDVRSVHLIDLFPQTFHLETVVRLERLR